MERYQFLSAYVPVKGLCILSMVLGISACDMQQGLPERDLEDVSQNQGVVSVAEANIYSSDVASKPASSADNQQKVTIPDYAVDYIGRYQATVACDGNFVPCQRGEAQFIINLLSDGTLRRSLIQYGKVYENGTASSGKATDSRDRWSVNPARTELVIHRKEGVNLYYHVKNNNHLIMNLEKIHSPTQQENQRLFALGFPKPNVVYELFKVDETVQ